MSQNRLWLKLDKIFFGLSQDVYLCAVYIPPISSPHYDNDFISLEGEVSTFSNKGNIVLIGDFSSRTGQNPDFIGLKYICMIVYIVVIASIVIARCTRYNIVIKLVSD